MSMQVEETRFPELAWLADVREIAEPLSESRPIWVSHCSYASQPKQWQAQRHPYCEVNLLVRGSMLHYSQRQQAPANREIFFWPGRACRISRPAAVIRWSGSRSISCPASYWNSTVAATEPKFCAALPWSIRPGTATFDPCRNCAGNCCGGFGELVVEFQRPAFGSRLKLRSRRRRCWSTSCAASRPRAGPRMTATKDNWVLAEKALNYLREHYAEQIYTRDLVVATGLSESKLHSVFQQCVGMPWVQYLQAYRIHRAAALLIEPGVSVTEAALTVGFENLGHFTTAFRAS